MYPNKCNANFYLAGQISCASLYPFVVIIFALPIFLMGTSCATTIHTGSSIQKALDEAMPGDTIVVEAGRYDPFIIDKRLTLCGVGGPEISSHVQTPGITVNADLVNITGFEILGVPADSSDKHSYFIDRPDMISSPGVLVLDLPNAGILVQADRVTIEDTTISGAEVGVLVKGGGEIILRNDTFSGCGSGLELQSSDHSLIELCQFQDSEKYGIKVENSDNITLLKSSLTGTKNVGAMLKESRGCAVEDNFFSTNWMGLVLWNSSDTWVQGNRANKNYYGMLITSKSDNNTIIENSAEENSGGTVSLFGIGISLQDCSYNEVVRNTLRNNFNGIELIDGSKFNVVSCNNISENSNGVRLDKTQNNLIYRNNFERNFISANDNSSHNFWNTTVGNYYSDYSGSDADGDGCGDQPYWIPKGDSCVADWHPLTGQDNCSVPDLDIFRDDLLRYARYSPEEDLPYTIEDGAIFIKSRQPTTWGL